MADVAPIALAGEKILVTGAAGQIASPICEALAADNEVWGIARFSNPEDRVRLDDLGVTTRRVDLAAGHLGTLPTDFTYVLHLAASISAASFDEALTVNAEGTGLLLQHCRSTRGVLVMSTSSVYRPLDDPMHPHVETDPLGDAVLPGMPTYAISKIAQEAVARFCARAYGVPVTIARLDAAYGPTGGLPAHHLDAILANRPVVLRSPHCGYSPIHQDDIHGQLPALLRAASTPATVVNWGGDEPVTSAQWCETFARLTGTSVEIVIEPVPGSQNGSVLDNTKRLELAGPCTISPAEGFKRLVEQRHARL